MMKRFFTLAMLMLALITQLSAETWKDVTSLVTNPDYESNADGWNLIMVQRDNVGQTNHCFRFYNSEGAVEQTITVPAPGTYRVSINAFMRNGAWSQDGVDAHAAGTEVINAYLYANDEQKTLVSLYSNSSTNYIGGGKQDSNGNYYPDNSSGAYIVLSNGLYPNSVTVDVGDDRQLTIGINTGEYIRNSWLVMTGWKVEQKEEEVQKTWTEPVKPTNTDNVTSATLVDGNEYFLFNIGAGQFLTSGGHWGTQATLSTWGMLVQISSYTYNGVSGYQIQPLQPMRHKDQGYINSTSYRFFRDAESSYGDWVWNSASYGILSIEKQSNGYYRIRAAADDPNYGSTALGANYDKQWFGRVMTDDRATDSIVNSNLAPGADNAIDWALVNNSDYEDFKAQHLSADSYATKMAVYNARLQLYNALEKAAESGTRTDEAAAVYNKANATPAELNDATDCLYVRMALHSLIVQAQQAGADVTNANATYTKSNATWSELATAYENLKYSSKEKRRDYAFSNASEASPMEITEFVMTNADMTDDCRNGWTPAGWTITVTGSNVGGQRSYYSNGDITISEFIEAWIQYGSLGNGVIAQTLTDMPSGKYILEADVNAYDQKNGNGSNVTGINLFIQGTTEKLSDPCATEEGKPEHYSVAYTHDTNGTLTVGLKVENTNCNWVAADNFRLYYCGGDAGPDPEVVPATSLQIANTTLSIEKGKSAQLGEITVLPENTTDRKTLTYTSNNTEVVTVTSTGIVTAKTVGSTTITVALEARPSVSKTITVTVTQPATPTGSWVDLTSEYITNPNYETSDESAWNCTYDAGNSEIRSGVREFWYANYDYNQTITVPAPGKYRISLKGYYRPGANSQNAVDAYENGYEDITAYLYANNDLLPLKSIYSESIENEGYVYDYEAYGQRYNSPDGYWSLLKSIGNTPIYEDTYYDGTRYSIYDAYFTSYPNTMETAANFFAEGKYQNTLETIVGDDCQLTIGVKNDNHMSNNWTIFTGWKLEFQGSVTNLTAIAFDKGTATLKQGAELQLTPSFTPSNATYRSVTWTSSNEKAATVDRNGLVKALKPGVTTITATSTHNSNISARVIITVTENTVAANSVIINEVQQANIDMFVDPSFNYGAWAELYNATTEDAFLDGLYISDDATNLKKMPLRSEVHGSVPAKGYCVLWFDHLSKWAPKMMSFNLDTDGETLYLSDESGKILSQVEFPPAISRTSWARTTDGGDTWGYTDKPTPGASNNGTKVATAQLAAPEVDRVAGFFDTPFTVQVTIPQGTTLRYTIDGSTPTLENGEVSTNGRFDINSTTILRLRLFQNGWLASPVTTRSYIYKDRNYTLPAISLVSDNKNLYGADLGIFVRGNGNGRPGNGQNDPCNWNCDWERPANIEYFDFDGAAVFTQEVGVEAAGGWSRAFEPHSFNIKAKKTYEGLNHMSYQFFKDKPYLRHKALKVRNGGNENNSGRIKDGTLQTIVATSGLYVETQAFRPVHVFHNGRYIGVENLREHNNKNYAGTHYAIDTDSMDFFKICPDSGYVQQEGDKEAFRQWYTLAENASDALAYEQIKELVDIEEFINYVGTEFYLGGDDYPKNNVKGFRERTTKQDNSRFRFVLFDVDFAFNTSDPFDKFDSRQYYTFDVLRGGAGLYPELAGELNYENRLTREIEFVTIFKNMLNNEEFRKQFIDQFCIIAGSVFEPERSRAIVDSIVNIVRAPMNIYEGYNSSNANNIRNNLTSSRQANLVALMRNYLSEYDDPISVTLSANIPGARIRINDLPVPTDKFSGKLFHPVTITALAPAGYAFDGWVKPDGTTLSSKETYTLKTSLTEANVVATYRKLGSSNRKAWDAHPIKVNEVSAGNDIFVNDYFKKNDWVELYNTTDKDIDVAGWYISDNLKKPEKFEIPFSTNNSFSTIVPAHGHLILWADKLETASQIHTGFKLANDSSCIVLTPADKSWADTLCYIPHTATQSVGLYPDGGTQLYVMSLPSIGKTNTISSRALAFKEPVPTTELKPTAINDTEDADLVLSLNDAMMTLKGAPKARLNIYDVTGKLVLTASITPERPVSIAGLPSGIYVATATTDDDQTQLKFSTK